MKMSQEHFEKLSEALKTFIDDQPPQSLESLYQTLKDNPKVKNVDMAYRWQILHASNFRIGDGRGLHGDINGEYTDDHVDTALRKFFGHKK